VIIRIVCMVALAFAFASQSVSAQQPAQIAPAKPSSSQPASAVPTAKTHPNDPMLWDTEQMMEDAVTQISTRYKLTNEQQEYTRLLLKKRVREFLDQYETDVRELLQESIDMRLGKKGTDIAASMKWAVRAAPIYDAAQHAILDGNTEWGQILNDEQKEIHKKDLDLMKKNFANVGGQLKQMEEGKGRMVDDRKVVNNGQGSTPLSGPTVFRRPELEDQWIAYVEKFITTYKLDDAKKIAAREKIHKEQLEKAKQYREANKDKFRQVEEDRKGITRELPVDKRMEKIRDADRKKKELESPVRQLFIDLCRRLDGLPSSKQRSEVTEEDKKALDVLYHRLAGDSTKKPMADREGGDKPAPTGDEKTPTSGPAATETPAKPAEEPKPVDAPKPSSDKPTTQSSN
jgi:hypothetical protein